MFNFSQWPTYRFVLIAVFFYGIAHIAFLPPFEGFDEPAHWSSISQWGHEGRMPIYGQDQFDRALQNYPGPMPYTFPGEISYQTFDFEKHIGPHKSAPPPEFVGVGGYNWQAQHPPLYYILLQPVFKVFNSMDWASQFFALRTLSWIFAFTGFVIGVEASKSLFKEHWEKAAIIMSAWPFLVPQFFPEMARIGNDSLCLLCFGIVWLAVLKLDQKHQPIRWAVILGIALGAGLWTKAFFVPITAGLAVYFCWRYWMEREIDTIKYGGASIGLALAIGVGWYVYKFIAYGNAIGGDEMLQFNKEGGVLVNFLENFSLIQMLRGYATIGMSFIYVGNWSLVRTSPWFLIGPAILLLWVGYNWLSNSANQRKYRLLPLFVLLPMLAGLSYHQILRIALDGEGTGTPGWYLHILTPALACIIAWGWPKHWGVKLLVVYGVLFAIYSWIMQLALFSGCRIPGPDNTGETVFDASKSCLIDGDNLAALTFPSVGIFMLLMATSILIFGWYSSSRKAAEKL